MWVWECQICGNLIRECEVLLKDGKLTCYRCGSDKLKPVLQIELALKYD